MSRKPPSQREPEYVVQRMNRTLQSMVPGTMGGRVANASPVDFDPETDTVSTASSGSASDPEETTGGSAHVIENDGTPLDARTYLNFSGSAVTVTDDPGDDATNVVIDALTQDEADARYRLLTDVNGHVVQDEGTPLTARPKLNFVGSAVTVTDDSANNRTNVTIDALTQTDGDARYRLLTDPSGHTVKDEGSTLTTRTYLDFVGPLVTASDDSGNDKTLVTVSDVRATATYTTASLAANAYETGTITLGKSYRLLRISLNYPARVRLYTTTAKRDADVSRPLGTDPSGDHGLVYEFVGASTLLAMDCAPIVHGASMAGTPTVNIPITVTNRDTVARAVTVTLTYVRTE